MFSKLAKLRAEERLNHRQVVEMSVDRWNSLCVLYAASQSVRCKNAVDRLLSLFWVQKTRSKKPAANFNWMIAHTIERSGRSALYGRLGSVTGFSLK